MSDQRKVTVRRLYEVECDDCGVVDSRPTRVEAELVAKQHRELHRQHPKWGPDALPHGDKTDTMTDVHGSYGLPYHHEGGDEHRHDGVTDIHEGGDRWHIHDAYGDLDYAESPVPRERNLGVMTPQAQEFFQGSP